MCMKLSFFLLPSICSVIDFSIAYNYFMNFIILIKVKYNFAISILNKIFVLM